jgi:hypothetical protein
MSQFEVVEDHDISWPQRRHRDLLDISQKALSIDRSVDHARRIDPVATQGGEEGQRAPTALRRVRHQARAASAAAVSACHIGLGPSFVDEDQTCGIKPALILLPLRPPPHHIGSFLLAGAQAFS